MMAFKRSLFGGKRRAGKRPAGGLRAGGLHADPEGRGPPSDTKPANRPDRREVGAQRGAVHPGDPYGEVDLLDDGGRRPGGWRSGIAIGTALTVFAGVLWYAYGWGIERLASTRLPLIVADTTPIKSRPEDPGGVEVLHQDVAVLNDAAPDPGIPQAERLLPPPEVPQPPLAVAPQAEVPQAEVPQAEAPQAEVPPAEVPPAVSVAKVEELLGPPLETAAGLRGKKSVAEAAPPPAVPLAVPQTAPLTAPETAQVKLPEAAPEPVLPEPVAETLRVPEPPAATAEPAPEVAALPDAKTGGFLVQLAALRAKDGARPAWARLQKAHPALLGDRELAIQRVDLGDRGIFYRIQAGFFADRAGAGDLCNALKARGQDCLVVKR